MGIVPTGYGNKANPVDNDSLWGYDSEGVANSNFLFSAIQTYVLNGLTTSEVAEGTNLYYTDARVEARITGKADKANVLELDNTTVFTPSADYEPATKKYVDDNPVAQSTTTVLGGNRIATISEVKTGTDTVKTVTSESNKQKDIDNIGTSTNITLSAGSSGNIQATQNGFVSCYAESAGSGSYNINIFTDSTATPTAKVAGFSSLNKGSCMYPIKKGDYYRVTNDDVGDTTNTVYKFIPLG